ncbi:unnamed protein product [Microthlaspi erraticum]|uniref:TF-B3 domain-containing protein n=1 Tax=Microthlaspi erraticum TaxID=1685480 RepID=A0A6D2IRC2_9BRAS|nr:unnamed protein product [Microthlaspi erraticum]
MVLGLSDLGPRCSENRDLPTQRSNNDQDKTGHISMKKHQHPRTEEDGGDDQDNTEFPSKKAKKSSPETEAGSFSSHRSCFVALVKASNLQNDALDLPKDVITSDGLKRKCSKIVIIDGGERSWALDLSFNKSSATFYISRGWRKICEENGKKAGGFFMFKLVGNGETPVLSFCSTESTNDGTRGDSNKKNNKEYCIELEKEKNRLSQNRYVTLTLTDGTFTYGRLHLPSPFMRENGLDKPGVITLLGKDGAKWLVNRLQEQGTGRMSLGKGWKEFAIANGLKAGGSFTLESIWQDTTPMLSLFHTDSSSDRREQGEYCSKASEKEPVVRNKCLPNENRFVTSTLTHDSLRYSRLRLPLLFTRENGLDEPWMITLLGKYGAEWGANLRWHSKVGPMQLTKGWNFFAEANGLKLGESFTLELIWKDATPMLKLSEESPSDRKQQGQLYSETSKKRSISTEPSSETMATKAKNNIEESRDPSSAIHNRFVTLTRTHEDVKLCLPLPFMRENGLDKPGMIILLGKDGTKWLVRRKRDCTGRMTLGKGWRKFAIANGLKIGVSFTLELIWQETTPMLSLFHTDSSSDKRQQGEHCSKASEKESVSAEPSNGNKTRKAKSNRDERSSKELVRNKCLPSSRASLSPKENRFVTVTLAHDSFRKSRLCLPMPFMRENGLDKPRLITLLGKDGTKWVANLRRESTGGRMSLGKGWKTFAKANGLKLGESITLELIWKDAAPMLSLFHTDSSSNRREQGEYCSKASEREPVYTEPNSGNKTIKAKSNREERSSKELVRNKFPPCRRASLSPNESRFATLTLTHDSLTTGRLVSFIHSSVSALVLKVFSF